MISIKVSANHENNQFNVSVFNGEKRLITFLYFPEECDKKFICDDETYDCLTDLLTQNKNKENHPHHQEVETYSKEIVRNFYEYFSFSD